MTPDPGASGLFPRTRWTLVGQLRESQSPEAERAMADLCQSYWYPLYVYARRFGLDEMDAKDAVQELFLQMVKGNRMALADASRGKLRTFLLTALKNVIGHWREKMQAARRGGGASTLSLDMQDAEGRYVQEIESSDAGPERLFERKWALELLRIAKERLQEDYHKQGKESLFTQLSPALLEGERWEGNEAAATALGMNEGAVKVALHRLRKRYRDLLMEEVSRTVGDDADVKDEVAYLMGLFTA